MKSRGGCLGDRGYNRIDRSVYLSDPVGMEIGIGVGLSVRSFVRSFVRTIKRNYFLSEGRRARESVEFPPLPSSRANPCSLCVQTVRTSVRLYVLSRS